MEEEELAEEISEDLELDRELDEDRLRKRTSEGFPSGNKTLVYGALVVLVLVVCFSFLFGGGSEVSREDLDAINQKMAMIEKRLSGLQSPEDRTDQVAGQFENIEKKLRKIEGASRSLKKRMDQLNSRVDKLQRQQVADRKAPVDSTPVSGRRYHTVTRGETLYGISKKYDISLTQLRRLNKLSKTEEIYPGQKLLVTPAGQ
jgi:LysM repeat protein